jgi:integrase/recombinase XerD
VGFHHSIALFMDYCQSKQLRPKTMASYEQTLKLFARWMEEEKRIARAEEVTEQHVREYIIDLQKRGKYTFCFDDRSMKLNRPTHRRDYRQSISNITINNYLRNLRVFFTWLEESDCIRKSPMRKEREIPQERPSKEYLEDEEVMRLLKSMDRAYFSEYRDMLVMMLMLDAGTRLGETLSAELEQFNIEKRSLYLPADKTKGRKERTVYFSEKTARELRHWLQYKDRYCESPYLFPVRHTGRKVQVSAYETNFAKYIRRAGIQKHLTAYSAE